MFLMLCTSFDDVLSFLTVLKFRADKIFIRKISVGIHCYSAKIVGGVKIRVLSTSSDGGFYL